MMPNEKVRIDWFLADVANVEVELTEELMAAMVGMAIQYLKVTGHMPWERWSLLSEASRAAFESAAEQLKVRETVDLK